MLYENEIIKIKKMIIQKVGPYLRHISQCLSFVKLYQMVKEIWSKPEVCAICNAEFIKGP